MSSSGSNGSGDRGVRVPARRAFLVSSGVALAGLVFWHYERIALDSVEAAPSGPPKQVTIVEFTDAGARKGVISWF